MDELIEAERELPLEKFLDAVLEKPAIVRRWNRWAKRALSAWKT
ncbi:MAG: hypothetical protein ACLT3Y_00985 [Ruminococcus callidus]